MNVGTMGTGEITTWFLTCWRESGNACYAIYSRSQQKGDLLKHKFHSKKVYTDIDLFLADSAIDVVYIATPNSLHFYHAKKALLANKHVILEKPFTSTLKECDALIQLAKQRNLFLMEGITVIDLPNCKKLSTLLPSIGKQHMVSANMSKVSSKYRSFLQGDNPNVFQTAFSGGALMDLNVYNIHLMIYLFGLPLNVHYVANKEKGIDISGCLTLEYKNFTVVCIGAKDSEASNYVEFQGEYGYLHVSSAAATLSTISLVIDEKRMVYGDEQTHQLTHFYYIQTFVDMLKHKNYKLRDVRLSHTRDVMQVLVQARACAHILFEADV